MTSLGGLYVVNSPAIGRYADYVLQDVVTAVRQRFSCRPELGIVGHSSGGFGALRLAMDFPGAQFRQSLVTPEIWALILPLLES